MSRSKEITKLGDHLTQFQQTNELVDIGMSEGDEELGFMARMLVQATLPHSDPGDVKEYGRVNGDFRLLIQPGLGMKLPYGVYPRLLLAWITTEAVRTKKRELRLGNSLSDFMSQLGLTPTGGRWGTITQLREQMKRLFAARIGFVYDTEESFQARTMEFATEMNLWWSPKSPDQAVIFDSTMTLGERFFEEIIKHPVPMDMRVLRAIKRSPLGLDLYLWLTYRVSYLKKPTEISWAQLHGQFGAEYSGEDGTKNFARKAKRELKKISVAWPELSYETPRGRLRLLPSRTSIPKKLKS